MDRRRKQARGKAITAPLLLLVLLAGCGAGGEGRGTWAGTDSTTLTILDPNHEAIFNPSWQMPAKFTLFEPMARYDDEGGFEPRLARRWTHSADYRSWTYHLRTDVRWHDGEPFDAGDVAFTLRLLSSPAVGWGGGSFEEVVVHDDSTVTIRFSEPYEGPDYWTDFYPEHFLSGLDPARFFEWDFWKEPVGNGPFRFVHNIPNTLWEMEANPDYYRGRPAVDRVRIKFSGGEPLVELRAGNVDIATYVTRAAIPKLEADPRFRIYRNMQPGLDWLEVIYWNHDHPFLGHHAVRRALTMALDRRELRHLQNLPADLPVFDVLATGRQFWNEELPEPHPHDPGRAAGLLERSGWTDGDGDGIREREGVDARFTMLVATGGLLGSGGWDQAAVYLQATYRNIGVAMEVRPLESGARDRIRSGDFDAALHRLHRFAFEEGRATEGLGYDNPRLAALMAAADSVVDPVREDSLYREAWPHFQRDIPVTFLTPQVQTFVTSRRVRGLEEPFQAHPYINLGDVWIEEGEAREPRGRQRGGSP